MDEYIKKPYTRILIPNDDGSYSAEILEFSGCFADGNTAEEAMKSISEAAKSWIEACLEQNLEIPEPFTNQNFGGKIALRLPRSLHRQAVRFAERDGVSLNHFLVSAIALKIGAEDLFARLLEKFDNKISSTTKETIHINYIKFPQNTNNNPEQDGFNLPDQLQLLDHISTEIGQDV
ncbi:MAG: type II toxin-antitoxin system HicB family antitoxin [Bacteroidales bacterium]|nr:type II toxin-antitoxin system HicB family antitoxin [Bacteroidales bacterium]